LKNNKVVLFLSP